MLPTNHWIGEDFYSDNRYIHPSPSELTKANSRVCYPVCALD